jgi:hypothetical protein
MVSLSAPLFNRSCMTDRMSFCSEVTGDGFHQLLLRILPIMVTNQLSMLQIETVQCVQSSFIFAISSSCFGIILDEMVCISDWRKLLRRYPLLDSVREMQLWLESLTINVLDSSPVELIRLGDQFVDFDAFRFVYTILWSFSSFLICYGRVTRHRI